MEIKSLLRPYTNSTDMDIYQIVLVWDFSYFFMSMTITEPFAVLLAIYSREVFRIFRDFNVSFCSLISSLFSMDASVASVLLMCM